VSTFLTLDGEFVGSINSTVFGAFGVAAGKSSGGYIDLQNSAE